MRSRSPGPAEFGFNPPHVTFTCSLTADEFVEGHMAALEDSRLGRFFCSWLALSLAFFAVSALMTVVAWAAGLKTETLGGIALVIIPMSLWLGYATSRGHARRWRQTFEETPAYREEVRWTLSDAGVDLVTASSRSAMPWSGFTKVIEGDPVIVLIGTSTGYFVPRRVFRSEAELAGFLAMVRRNVTNRSA